MPRDSADFFLEHGFVERAVSNADIGRIELIAQIIDAVGGTAGPRDSGTSSSNGMYLVDHFAIMFAQTLLDGALAANHYDGDAIGEEAYRLSEQLLRARRYYYDKIHREVEGGKDRFPDVRGDGEE